MRAKLDDRTSYATRGPRAFDGGAVSIVMFPGEGRGRQSNGGRGTFVTDFFDELKRLVPTDP